MQHRIVLWLYCAFIIVMSINMFKQREKIRHALLDEAAKEYRKTVRTANKLSALLCPSYNAYVVSSGVLKIGDETIKVPRRYTLTPGSYMKVYFHCTDKNPFERLSPVPSRYNVTATTAQAYKKYDDIKNYLKNNYNTLEDYIPMIQALVIGIMGAFV
jgi:hypothetical protein